MKKVSTRAAAQSRNISQQKLTIGLDLGDRNSWYCVVDEAGQIAVEQRVRTNAKALQEAFGPMPRSRIALEIGTHSPWISRLLSELGHEVIVANARKVRLIGESRKKDDRLDAQALARLARIDPELLYPVKHRSAQAQYESGESRRAQSGTASGTGAVAGVHRIGERADLRVQRTDRSSGPAELSAGGAAEAGEGRGNVNRADVFADAGRPASLPQEPRCGLLSGAAAGTKKLWSERAANAHQQGRRPVSADVVGARSAAHSGSVRS